MGKETTMFTRILVPLDGSTRAEQALPIAARIARASGARILLVRAVVVPVTYGVTMEGESLHWRLAHDETEEAQTYLNTMAQSETLKGLPVEGIVKVGVAANVILDAVAERGVDLVVLTSHGRTGFTRWVLGSVAQHVAHHSTAPVLVLRRHGEGEAEGEDFSHVLVPLDGSPLAESALEAARSLALALSAPGQARIHLVLVIAPYESVPSNMPEALIMEGAQSYLERVGQRLASESEEGQLAVTWSVVANLDIAQGILSVAEAAQGTEGTPPFGRSGVIAMATHGYGGVERWALGSIAERVLHASKHPMLIVRPPEVVARARGAGPPSA
jgi:nucleotide-binding universal stress UspA family protein